MYLQSLPILLPVLSLQELPVLELTADDTRITESVRIVIPEGLVIADVNGNGVLHVVADDVRILFTEGSVLNGASPRLLPDQYTGVGVRVEGQSGLRIEGLRVRGFKAGVYATQANGLAIDRADVTDNFAERLRSTPTLCDDGSDWLHCHDNENNEWLQNYGAGIYIEDSRGVSVTRSRARRTQNGCLLDAVTDALVSDCDFSFLSGWGLGLWRTSDSIIAHNAFDFCIRGYSHGVYNRGQDSAGILVFEQCSNNAFVDNSATHGGDGIFGFAGREALGERASEGDGFDATRLGNNDNLFRGNDLSYAAAHGLEMTFSFGNRVMNNSFAGNAICGIWGGYSQGMLIHDNWFDSNGDAGYGLERGGVNIEHSMDNWIVRNAFTGNKCGVHLWWDEDVGLMKSAWAKANIAACSGNGVVGNRFTGDQVALHLRTCEPVAFADNTMVDVGVEVDGADGCTAPADPAVIPPCTAVVPEAMGTSPVGARKHLAGRENIIMGEWGPWDHESAFLHLREREGSRHLYMLHNFEAGVKVTVSGAGVELERSKEQPLQVVVKTGGTGFFPYELRVGSQTKSDFLEQLHWRVACFRTTQDPREHEDAWQEAARAATVVTRDTLKLPFAMGGPADLGIEVPGDVGGNAFGTLATTELHLEAGRYQISCMSDDGLRVYVDDERVIDNWTWHAPTEDKAEFEVAQSAIVRIRVEHFELDGYALLEFGLAAIR